MGFFEKAWKFGLIAAVFGTTPKGGAEPAKIADNQAKPDDIGMLMEQLDNEKLEQENTQFRKTMERWKAEKKLGGKSYAEFLNEKSRKKNPKSQYKTGRVDTRSKIYGNDPLAASRLPQGQVAKGHSTPPITKKLI